ncbi:MAG: sensor histidine kinase [Acidobacteria bacterium]|nr:sensor histidine kinase [Acidobacteriota bacterium]
MGAEPRQRLRLKAALLLGFGLIFGIWLFAGSYFTRRMLDVGRRASDINARFIQAQELLSTVRVQLLLGSVDVRDALLDPNPAAAAEYRRRMEQTFDRAASALRLYVPILDSGAEQERVGRLQAEITDFRQTMRRVLATDGRSPTLDSDDSQWPVDARLLFRTRIVPKRELVIRVFEEVQGLNRSAYVQQQRELDEVYAATQQRLWQSIGIALLASLGVGLIATLYASRLEERLREQRLKDLQTSHELQDLSAKLITAQEEERRNIARELHDEVGQVLTAIKVELAVAQHAIEAGGAGAQTLADARAITDGALTTVRDLSQLLHPPLLDDMGLPAVVEWYLSSFGKRHGVRTDVLLERMDARLPPEIETTAYRIIQEALTNVARHARAASCRVRLERRPLALAISVEDDGIGFDPAEAERPGRRHGLGLIGIRERAARLHGTARFESAPGEGTRLVVVLPTIAWNPTPPAPAPAADIGHSEPGPAAAPAV